MFKKIIIALAIVLTAPFWLLALNGIFKALGFSILGIGTW